ncbi:TetR/AcrR family transcriptional regulator [Patulibacter brassicae]|uniref:TetR/AcrR family transcriptional regulator n=1 Tax=Patulibacter brassicae TaxID=1705717 RepID=UPI0029F46E5C|nr:helix-turn-helix domain-containing protein [Patulibacter brassicae]
MLDAGAEIIADRGASGLRIAEITSRAGVALGSFQNHFASKDELVAAVVGESIEALAGEIGAVAEADGDPAESAIAALRRFVRRAYEDPELCRVLVNLDHGERLFVEASRPFAETALSRACDAGRFAIDDLDIAVSSIIAGALAVVRRILDGHVGADADRVVALSALRAFGVDEPEAARIARLPLPSSHEAPARRGTVAVGRPGEDLSSGARS